MSIKEVALANQSNLKIFEKALIGWKSWPFEKSHFVFEYVNRLLERYKKYFNFFKTNILLCLAFLLLDKLDSLEMNLA